MTMPGQFSNDELLESQSIGAVARRGGGMPQRVANRNAAAMVDVESNRAVAEVQASMLLARRMPRDEMAARERILNEFARPALAEHAVYTYAKGGTDITGLSIRAAECIARQWGNMSTEIKEVERAAGYSVMMARAWDLQTGTSKSMTFQVPHRRDTRGGSYEITDSREIYELGANLGSRRLRACIFALIPVDILDDAQQQAEDTLRSRAEVTPDKLKKMLETFAEFGVTQAAIERRLQRKLESITPAQVVQMQKIYTSMRDGMSKASDWFEEQPAPPIDVQQEDEQPPATNGGKPAEAVAAYAKRAAARGVEGLKRRVEPAAAPAAANDGKPTYAEVRERLENAADLAELDHAYAQIDGVPAHMRPELYEIAEQAQARLAAHGGEAA